MKNTLYDAEHAESRKPPMYNRQDIASMLHADNHARKHHNWQLVPSAEILTLNKQLIRAAIHHSTFFNESELLVVNERKSINELRKPRSDFRETFPFVDAILNAFPGKLIVAGGSIYKAFQSEDSDYGELLSDCDVDFFFINCTLDQVEEIIRFVIKLLKSPKKHLQYFSGDMKEAVEEGTYDEIGLCIDRCQNATTIYYDADGDYDDDSEGLNYRAEYGWLNGGGKLQFIHRSYPSPLAVVGGFDLGVCMGFYDGHDFYATPFGAWSIATQTIILDVSRRSTSFEYRIIKYITKYLCRLVIVNGSCGEAFEHVGSDERLKWRVHRPFWPVKGLKTTSRHLPTAEKYTGVDERIADRKAAKRMPLPTINIDEYKSDEDEDYVFEGRSRDPENDRDLELRRERDSAKDRLDVHLNRFSCDSTIRDGVSDYAGGTFHDFNVEQSNGIFAAQGKVDYITWRSGDASGCFDKPLVRYKLHPDFIDNEEGTRPQVMYMDALRRWFTPEQIEKLKAGPTTPPMCVPLHPEIFKEYIAEIHRTAEASVALAQEKAKLGITLITENPGRQWTASRNPVVSDVRDYYHPVLLAKRGPMLIGVPHEIYCLLRLAQLKSDSIWRMVPRDVLKLIMTALADLLADDGNELLLQNKK